METAGSPLLTATVLANCCVALLSLLSIVSPQVQSCTLDLDWTFAWKYSRIDRRFICKSAREKIEPNNIEELIEDWPIIVECLQSDYAYCQLCVGGVICCGNLAIGHHSYYPYYPPLCMSQVSDSSQCQQHSFEGMVPVSWHSCMMLVWQKNYSVKWLG